MSIFMRSWRDGTEAFAWNIRHKSGVTPQGIYVCRSAKEKGQAVNPIWDDSLFGRRKEAMISKGIRFYFESPLPIRRHEFRYAKSARRTFIVGGASAAGRMEV